MDFYESKLVKKDGKGKKTPLKPEPIKELSNDMISMDCAVKFVQEMLLQMNNYTEAKLHSKKSDLENLLADQPVTAEDEGNISSRIMDVLQQKNFKKKPEVAAILRNDEAKI